ncbi:DNA-directed RNA polymerase III subunit RPC5-like [Eupeodes corollae]|uniref:DNA-directed RNA polymerase III subunit RPC5-like n=1 Tax=Eupeodes corollae TaxID=290404 RepID=UPI0024911A4B|nr:DNA-directed RNA polymerase III subunit RPC5-like [Eupeodes corollae]
MWTVLKSKQSYTSTKSIDNAAKYIVGILQDKEVHLSPLTSILQLRPSFQYFDKEDKRAKAEEKSINEEDDDEELQQVTVKFSKTGANRSKKIKDKSYDSFVKRCTEEPWCETLWHPRTSPTAELERQKLFATQQQTSHSMELKATKYAGKLLIQNYQEMSIDTVLPSKVIGKNKLKTMPLTDQLKVILKDARMLTFDDIMSILTESDECLSSERNLNGVNSAEKCTPLLVLRTLALVGVLIKGNWVAKSEVIYPPDNLSNANGVCSDLMIRARDYILYKFSKQEFLDRRQVIQATQLPPEEALETLQSVAKLNTEKKWQLLLPPDKTFINRYSDHVQRQDMLWQATEQTFNEMDFEKSPKRVRKRSVREAKLDKSLA